MTTKLCCPLTARSGKNTRRADEAVANKDLPSMDTGLDAEQTTFTKEDFETALKKVSRKIQPEK